MGTYDTVGGTPRSPDDLDPPCERCGRDPYDCNCMCSCGSGEFKEAVNDARGIFVAYVCGQCRERKLSGYRRDIFTDPNYWTDEEI